jgi:CHC2 zinc finger
MCALSNIARSDSYGETSSDTGDTSEAYGGKDHYEELNDLANTIPLIKVFKHYNIYCNEANHKIRCPFKSHSDGHERTASFYYYHKTNSFKCFGCNKGAPFAHATHFVSAMDGITLPNARAKVLSLFKDSVGEVDSDSYLSTGDFDERLNIMMDLSNVVREFYQTHRTEDALKYFELICAAYDNQNAKREPDNEALRRLVQWAKGFIEKY